MNPLGLFKKHKLLIFFVAALLFRLSLLFYDYSFDVNNHILWAKDLHERGFTNFYTTRSSEVFATPYPNYPPFSLFVFYLLYPIQSLLKNIIWYLNVTFSFFPSQLVFFVESRAFLAGIMKLPGLFADLGVAWVSLLLTRKFFPKNLGIQKLVILLVLFNPVYFFTSALWGQIDSIPIFFTLLAFYLLLERKQVITGGIIFAVGLLIKPTTLVYLPFFLLVLGKKYGLSRLLKTVVISTVFFWLAFLPFTHFIANPLYPYHTYLEKIIAAQSLPYITNGAFNLWAIVGGFIGIKDTAPFLFGISYRWFGYSLTGIVYLLLLLRMWKLKKFYFYVLFLGSFAAFMFLTKMHERYTLLFLTFAIVSYLFDRKLLPWVIVLSLTSFLNIYHSWSVPKIGFIMSIQYNPLYSFFISLLNLTIFFVLLGKFMTSKKTV